MGKPAFRFHLIIAFAVLPCFFVARLDAQTIFDAAPGRNADGVRELLAADSAPAHATDNDGCTLLHHAAEPGHIEVVSILPDAGADIDAREDDETPLHYAAWRSQLAVSRLLITRGADVEARNHWGRTPLLIVGAGQYDNLRLSDEAKPSSQEEGV